MQLIQQASSYAASVDGLILLITGMVGFWFILANVVFFGLIDYALDRLVGP